MKENPQESSEESATTILPANIQSNAAVEQSQQSHLHAVCMELLRHLESYNSAKAEPFQSIRAARLNCPYILDVVSRRRFDFGEGLFSETLPSQGKPHQQHSGGDEDR